MPRHNHRSKRAKYQPPDIAGRVLDFTPDPDARELGKYHPAEDDTVPVDITELLDGPEVRRTRLFTKEAHDA